MRYIVLLAFFMLFAINANTQNIGINSDGSDPDASAMLDIKSSTSGLLMPRMTSLLRTGIVNPAAGLVVYDTDKEGFMFYNGASWIQINDKGGNSSSDITDSDKESRVYLIDDTDSILFMTDNVIRMILDEMGRLGIGTTDPQADLHIYNSTTNVNLILQAASNQESILSFLTGVSDPWTLSLDGTSSFLSLENTGGTATEMLLRAGSNQESILSFKSGANDKWVFSLDGTNGFIGLENTNAAATTEMMLRAGSNQESILSFKSGTSDKWNMSLDGTSSILGIENTSGTAGTEMMLRAGSNQESILSFKSGTNDKWQMDVDGATNDFAIAVGGADVMMMNNAGNVGIGTTPNASYALNVGGDLHTTGLLHSGNTIKIDGVNYEITTDSLIAFKLNNSEIFRLAYTGNVAIGTNNPSNSAILDIASTTKGLLIPRMTTAQKSSIASPATGLLVFDTDLSAYYFYNGSTWNSIAGSGSPSGSNGTIQFNNSGTFGSNSNFVWDNTNTRLGVGVAVPLYNLDVSGTTRLSSVNINSSYNLPTTDGTNGQVLKTNGTGTVSWSIPDASSIGGIGVNITGVLSGEVLLYNGTNWTNGPVNATKIDGVNVSASSPSNNQVLTYNSSLFRWEPGNTNVGSGNSNYITKWTGTNSLGNSIIQDDAVNVGIGISPSSTEKLLIDAQSSTTAVKGNYSTNIYGSLGSSSYGAYGQNDALTWGALGASGYGVIGNASGAGTAVYGSNGSSSGYIANSTYGLYGSYGPTWGAIGSSSDAIIGNASGAGRAVYGTNGTSTGFLANSTYGVYGSYGTTWGAIGSSTDAIIGNASGAGRAIFGTNGSNSGYIGGSTYAVYGASGTNWAALGTSTEGVLASASGANKAINASNGSVSAYMANSTYGLYAQFDANKLGYVGSSNYGVYGQYTANQYGALGSMFYGVYGQSDASHYGGIGTANSAISGSITAAATGISYGGYFSNSSTAAGTSQYGANITVSGNTGTSTKYGVNAATTGTANINYGVYATASGGTNNYGVYTSGSQYGIYAIGAIAGYFQGNVSIGGTAAASELRFYEAIASGTNYSSFKSQAQAANVTYTLPVSGGNNGEILTTSGGAAPTLSWTAPGTSYTGTGAANYITKFTGAQAFASSTIWDDGTYVGFGIASGFLGKYNFKTSGTENMVIFDHTGTSGNTFTAYNSGTGNTFNIYKSGTAGRTIYLSNTSSGSDDVFEIQSSSQGTGIGLYMTGTAGSGIEARINNASNTSGVALKGTSISSGYALQAMNSNAQTTSVTTALVGNYANSSTAAITKTGLEVASTGTWNGATAVNRAIYANATDGTTNYGIYASASGGATNFAGYFAGNLALGSSSELRFYEPSAGPNYTAFISQLQTSDITYTLPATSGSSGQVLSTSGGAAPTLSWINPGSGWGLTGNAGTVDGTNFIGTTDNVPLSFRVNSNFAGKIDNGAYHTTSFGYWAGKSLSTAYDNTAIGYYALSANVSGGSNTAVGSYALRDATGGSNTAIGYQALILTTTSAENTAVGRSTLYSNTTGQSNTAMGSQSLYLSSTGSNNTAIGTMALFNNNAGSNGTAIGFRAMYNANDQTTAYTNYNTAVGYYSLYGSATPSANTGNNNTALGYYTLFFTSSGNHNTAIGYNAGYTSNSANAITTGNNNTFLGSGTGFASATQRTNSTAIGYNALVDADNALILGGTGSNAVKVGVGVTAPTAFMHIVSTGTSRGVYVNNTGALEAGNFTTNNAANANPAVYGTTNGTGAAVYGFHSASSGTTIGVFGESMSSTGHGVYGTSNYIGVLGYIGTAPSNSYAGKFDNSATSAVSHYGVSTSVNGATGTGIKYGVYSNVSGSATTNYGIYASAIGGTNNYAGYFSGDVYISGKATSNMDFITKSAVYKNVKITNGNYNIISTDHIIVCNNTANITLPAPAGNNGREIIVRSASGANVTVIANANASVIFIKNSGTTTNQWTLAANGIFTLICDGTYWYCLD